MKADLVCKGGGIKGIALVGAISYLEEYGYEWEKIAGTSAGAIVASLLAVGYTAKEIKDILYSIDYKCFIDKNKLQSIPLIGRFAGLLVYKGIYEGYTIEEFLNTKFKEKGKTKFKDISINKISKLKLIAADVTNKKLLILPDDLVNYNIDPMEFDISKAVRMSISIPFYYNPVVIKNHKKSNFIVDGGLLSNFPIWLFDVDGIPRWPTIGLNLIDEEDDNSSSSGLISYMLDVIQTSLYTNEDIYFKDQDSIRIVNIPTLGIKTTQFNIDKSGILNLYESGYNSAKSFLYNWNFESYINRYRRT